MDSKAAPLALADPERAIAVTYAPAAARSTLAALFALDERLAGVLRTTSQPLIGQMRLTWWHEALAALSAGAAPPPEPVLVALAELDPDRTASLTRIVEGWEALLDEPLTLDAIRVHAVERGETLFAVAAPLCGIVADDGIRAAGRGWALADVARHLSDRTLAEQASAAAGEAMRAAPRRWPRRARPLGMLARLARQDAAGAPAAPPASRRRVASMLWHALTGRA
nr:squalene/phytoene synthase family protein [Sphingomonas jejuensis]